ncbi:hypothetical protein SDC9_136821 [bioreactor metagenome]|uniref:Uncharacterized protein n=1 Tax=bioreactor metagenome TaxID=1076179 RepID=A0A645DK75_9ZZZZ|nr:MoaD/ThiS family protein [Proteiniclasticum sp. QWL-01]WFF71480.1 MoaD/ThiS family protein [Proteiniclasticum sp. QWL-01]
MIISVWAILNSAPSLRQSLELAEYSTVQNALNHLGLTEHLQIEGQVITILVNGREAVPDTVLADNDRLLLLQAMTGG